MSLTDRIIRLKEYAGGYSSESLKQAFCRGVDHVVEIITDEVRINEAKKIETKQNEERRPLHVVTKDETKSNVAEREYKKYTLADKYALNDKIKEAHFDDKQTLDNARTTPIANKKKFTPWINVNEVLPSYGIWANYLIRHTAENNRCIYYVLSYFMNEDEYANWVLNDIAPEQLKNAEYWCIIPEFPEEVKAIMNA